MIARYCSKCGRLLRPWPLQRPNTCSPRGWVYCIRRPLDLVCTSTPPAAQHVDGVTSESGAPLRGDRAPGRG